jgi:hypothetical protein
MFPTREKGRFPAENREFARRRDGAFFLEAASRKPSKGMRGDLRSSLSSFQVAAQTSFHLLPKQ